MDTNVSFPTTEVTKSVTLQKGTTSTKRWNLTELRRERIEFFVHKSVDDPHSFGRVRSPQWMELLVKFMNTPGVDEKVLLSWLDKIPCLKSNELYDTEFYRKYLLVNRDSSGSKNLNYFPKHWNDELVEVFRDTETVPIPMQG